MSDKRCGTCKWWDKTEFTSMSKWGNCINPALLKVMLFKSVTIRPVHEDEGEQREGFYPVAECEGYEL